MLKMHEIIQMDQLAFKLNISITGEINGQASQKIGVQWKRLRQVDTAKRHVCFEYLLGATFIKALVAFFSET